MTGYWTAGGAGCVRGGGGYGERGGRGKGRCGRRSNGEMSCQGVSKDVIVWEGLLLCIIIFFPWGDFPNEGVREGEGEMDR